MASWTSLSWGCLQRWLSLPKADVSLCTVGMDHAAVAEDRKQATEDCTKQLLVRQAATTALTGIRYKADSKETEEKMTGATLGEANVAKPQDPQPAILMTVPLGPERHLIRLRIHPNTANLSSHIGTLLALSHKLAQLGEPALTTGAPSAAPAL